MNKLEAFIILCAEQSQNHGEVYTLSIDKLRRASQHYNLVRPENVRVIWPDICFHGTFTNIMQTSENLDLTWHLRSPVGKSTNRTLGDALN